MIPARVGKSELGLVGWIGVLELLRLLDILVSVGRRNVNGHLETGEVDGLVGDHRGRNIRWMSSLAEEVWYLNMAKRNPIISPSFKNN